MNRQEAKNLPKGRRVGPEDLQNAGGISPSTSTTLSWYMLVLPNYFPALPWLPI